MELDIVYISMVKILGNSTHFTFLYEKKGRDLKALTPTEMSKG